MSAKAFARPELLSPFRVWAPVWHPRSPTSSSARPTAAGPTSSSPSSAWTRTRAERRISGFQPPSGLTRTNPSSSTWRTMNPISSMCAAIRSSGASSPPSTVPTTFPMASVRRRSTSPSSSSATSSRGSVSKPTGPWDSVSSRRRPYPSMAVDPSARRKARGSWLSREVSGRRGDEWRAGRELRGETEREGETGQVRKRTDARDQCSSDSTYS